MAPAGSGGVTAVYLIARPEGLSYYEILGVSETASPAQVNEAFRRKCKELKIHPDVGGDPEEFRIYEAARATLSDPRKKIIYDLYGVGELTEEQLEQYRRRLVEDVQRIQDEREFSPQISAKALEMYHQMLVDMLKEISGTHSFFDRSHSLRVKGDLSKSLEMIVAMEPRVNAQVFMRGVEPARLEERVRAEMNAVGIKVHDRWAPGCLDETPAQGEGTKDAGDLAVQAVGRIMPLVAPKDRILDALTALRAASIRQFDLVTEFSMTTAGGPNPGTVGIYGYTEHTYTENCPKQGLGRDLFSHTSGFGREELEIIIQGENRLSSRKSVDLYIPLPPDFVIQHMDPREVNNWNSIGPLCLRPSVQNEIIELGPRRLGPESIQPEDPTKWLLRRTREGEGKPHRQ